MVTMPAASVKIDLSRFKPEMDKLKSDLPRRSKLAMNRIAVRLIFLMKRVPPCPVLTGRLRGSVEDDLITQDKVVVGPHTEYALKQNKIHHFVDKAVVDVQKEVVPIFNKMYRGMSK